MTSQQPPTPLCLRCSGVTLRALDDSPKDISFFECPSCRRQYAKGERGSLTYRWLHPISRPLYAVLFSANPVAEAARVANRVAAQSSSATLEAMTREIELELEQPTQQVRDILDSPHSEETCRQFLAAVAKLLREQLAKA